MPDGDIRPPLNLSLWNVLRGVDRKFTKPITGKSYKGDSPNPTYIIMKLTEHLGPIGQKWGFDVVRSEVRLGRPHQVIVEQTQEMLAPDAEGKQRVKSKTVRYEIIREEYHEVEIAFWQTNIKGNRFTFSAYGGTPMLYMSKSGNWVHDEDAAKKSLTDAYTKAASWLGACADIFLGIFDDKYTSQPDSNALAGRSITDQPENRAPESDGGWDGDPGSSEPEGYAQPPQKQPDPSRETSAPDGW